MECCFRAAILGNDSTTFLCLVRVVVAIVNRFDALLTPSTKEQAHKARGKNSCLSRATALHHTRLTFQSPVRPLPLRSLHVSVTTPVKMSLIPDFGQLFRIRRNFVTWQNLFGGSSFFSPARCSMFSPPRDVNRAPMAAGICWTHGHPYTPTKPQSKCAPKYVLSAMW